MTEATLFQRTGCNCCLIGFDQQEFNKSIKSDILAAFLGGWSLKGLCYTVFAASSFQSLFLAFFVPLPFFGGLNPCRIWSISWMEFEGYIQFKHHNVWRERRNVPFHQKFKEPLSLTPTYLLLPTPALWHFPKSHLAVLPRPKSFNHLSNVRHPNLAAFTLILENAL